MAGHNKWSKVKHIKGPADAKRGKIFSKLAREITMAAKTGGGDPATNFQLRTALQNARAQNMPSDTIDRALKKGTGEIESQTFQKVIYEGYGPAGVAIVIEAATDNKNRTAADLRNIFSKHSGNLATSGSVMYLFEQKGEIVVDGETSDYTTFLDVFVESEAEHSYPAGPDHIVLTPPKQLHAIAESFRSANILVTSEKLIYRPTTTVKITDLPTAQQVARLCEALDDCDDVLDAYPNLEVTAEISAVIGD